MRLFIYFQKKISSVKNKENNSFSIRPVRLIICIEYRLHNDDCISHSRLFLQTSLNSSNTATLDARLLSCTWKCGVHYNVAVWLCRCFETVHFKECYNQNSPHMRINPRSNAQIDLNGNCQICGKTNLRCINSETLAFTLRTCRWCHIKTFRGIGGVTCMPFFGYE